MMAGRGGLGFFLPVWHEPGQRGQGGQGASPQELSPAVARGLHAGSTDGHVATGSTDPILIILTRPEALAAWVPRVSHAGRPNSLAETGQLGAGVCDHT